jgi:2-methylisocitrate lyase-like PEP mutase family enzyme
MRDIIAAFSLPVLVDADDGYGDVKNVICVVQGYEAMGASAIFFEDQRTPKRCGLVGKQVVSSEMHVAQIRSALAARHNPETFNIARTDARGVPLATTMLEGRGRTPWIDPKELKALGYSMVLYPTAVIFHVVRAIQKAVEG